MKYHHHPFEITPQRAEAWLHCMKEAIIEAGLDQKEAGSLALLQSFKTSGGNYGQFKLIELSRTSATKQ